MFLALITLLTSLVISGVSIYYSVSGLAAIFAAAAVPIIIMGASLEVGKLVTALWLHRNWKTAPLALKTYLMIATLVLMFITSIGIFGFLSRAHIEQTAGIGTVSTQIEQLNLDIRLEQDKIDNNRKIIAQLDTAVNNLLQGSATQSQQTRTGNAQQASNLATQATRLRQQQNTERTKLQTEITEANNKIAELNRKKLELDQKIKNIETEVGPIKYIAQFVYGTEAGTNKDLLEKAVTWLILIIIFVFDPLAVLLLIASQISWMEATARWRAKRDAKQASTVPAPVEIVKEESKITVDDKKDVANIISHNDERNVPTPVEIVKEESKITVDDKKDVANVTSDHNADRNVPALPQPVVDETKVSAFPTPVNSQITDSVTQAAPVKEQLNVEAWNKMIEEAEKAAIEEKIIKEPKLKKKRILHDENRGPTVESGKEIVTGYVQNSEQSGETIWKRVRHSRNIFKPMDILYNEYQNNGFNDLQFTDQELQDPEIQQLTSYIEAVKAKQMKLDDIPIEYREKLAKLIVGDDLNTSNTP